ncbi:hypothetical protein [Streptomyces sp. NPDC052036]|uniref:hypothetical protein n=1 Tax=Streptomyces sp. NPDC052036 TaxID=3155171 RepID=UPI003422D7C4
MSRWGTLFSRWSPRGRRSADDAGPATGTGALQASVLMDDYATVTLLRSSERAVPGPEDAAELARALEAAADPVATLVVGMDGQVPPALWSELGDLLDRLRDSGSLTVRLVVSGAGGNSRGGPALAQRISDAWGIRVIAPEATALLIPGGSLFVPDAPEPHGGWRLFEPGTPPTPLGPRQPAPGWQSALAELPAHPVRDCVVQHIPAGLLIRPPGSRTQRPGALCYAVPVDAARPLVLVGLPEPGGDAAVPVDDLAAVLAALPPKTRSAVRLAPGAGADLLPTAQQVADALGIEVEVLTGLPLADPAGGAGPVLVDGGGRPTWRPYAESVACRPSPDAGRQERPAPRLVRWRPPLSATGPAEAGTVPLTEGWHAVVTRAGLALAPTGTPVRLAGLPVRADQFAVELVAARRPLDGQHQAALTRLLTQLEPGVRPYAVLHAPGRTAEESRLLRRLAVHYGVRLLWPWTAGADPDALPVVAAEAIETIEATESVEAIEPAEADPVGRLPHGFEAYRDLIGAIVRAADAGRHDDAVALAASLEKQAFEHHGPDDATALQVRQIRAHVLRLAGRHALAAALYRQVALSLLTAHRDLAHEAEKAAANADACWRAIPETALARRVAPAIVTIRRRIPGPEGRPLRAAERYRAQLDAAHGQIPPAAETRALAPVPAGTVPPDAADTAGATDTAGAAETGDAADAASAADAAEPGGRPGPPPGTAHPPTGAARQPGPTADQSAAIAHQPAPAARQAAASGPEPAAAPRPSRAGGGLLVPEEPGGGSGTSAPTSPSAAAGRPR